MAYTDQEIAEYAKKLEQAGASPEKIRDFVSRAKYEQAPQQTQQDPGIIQSIAQTVAHPILKAGASIASLGISAAGLADYATKSLMGDKEGIAKSQEKFGGALEKLDTEGADFGYLGKVKPIAASMNAAKTPTESLGALTRESVGTGAEIASFLPFGRGVKAGFEAINGSAPLLNSLLRSVGSGATSGALGAGGMALQDTEMSLPEVALTTAVGTVAGGTLGAGGALSARGVKAVAGKLFPNLEKEAADAVVNAVKRGIQPPVRKVKTAAESEAYYNQAAEAFSDIATKRGAFNLTNEFGETAGELPSTVAQLGQAIEQGKRIIFDGYSTLAKIAGIDGRELSTANLVSDLRKIAQDERILRYNPSASKYASRLASDLERRGSFNLLDAQEEVQFLNEGLKRLYGAGDVPSTNKIWIDKFVADRLRSGLDAVVDAETGQEYQALRNMYRNYKTIEDDVNHRAAVELRKAGASLPDFLNIQSVGDVVLGLASGQPSMVIKGAAQKALTAYYKYLNSPNQAIQNAFKALEKTTKKLDKEGEIVRKGIQVKIQKKPPLSLPAPSAIQLPPKGGYSGGAMVSQGGSAAPVTQMSQNEAKRILVKKGAITPEQGAPDYKNRKNYAPKLPPQSAAGVASGIEPEYDEKGNIKGYKIDPVKSGLGILIGGTLGKNSKTFKELMKGNPITKKSAQEGAADAQKYLYRLTVEQGRSEKDPLVKSTQEAINLFNDISSDVRLSPSKGATPKTAAQAKAAGMSFDEWVKGQETPKTVTIWKKSRFSEGGGYADVPVLRKVENITLYQGGPGEGRQFWTSNEKYASQFGKVVKKTGAFYKVDNGNRVTDVYVEAPSRSQLKEEWDKASVKVKKPR